MNLIVTCEFRFFRTPDNKVWTTSAFQYDFWLRYLDIFTQVKVVARVKPINLVNNNWKQVCGYNVSVIDLPHYIGFLGLIKNALKIRKIIKKNITPHTAIIYRVPSQTAMIATFGNGKEQGYALEVVGDPYDVFTSGITNKFLDKMLAMLSFIGLRAMARKSLAACYVTESYLQQRYPVSEGGLSVGCSDIELHAESFIKKPRIYTKHATNLVFIGSFDQLYKGPDILISAIAKLNQKGFKYTATILGGGKYLEEMQQLARSLHCINKINFVGEIPHSNVNAYLDNADVFVMPSRTEGLPRALIEAMARALPCLASSVGGIPELLDSDFMITENNSTNLAKRIHELCRSTKKLNYASRNNLDKAQNYKHSLLIKKRRNFYQQYFLLKST